jgi:hypothetical protein
MKTITMYVTFDNARHATQKDALRHLEALHGNKLSSLAARLLQEGNCKHISTGNFIDENLPLFAELQRIKDDMQLITDDNEEE